MDLKCTLNPKHKVRRMNNPQGG